MDDFLGVIYGWFKKNRRELPWRQTTDPYRIWLSEIILQQTRVVQGTNYYLRFIERFPNIKDLANATEEEVLKEWQGLGYYTRARNLHFTARYIQDKLHGNFPSDYNSILNLKGIGPYTAAAIASIAFDISSPAVDGNIYRLFSRYFGISIPIDTNKGKKEIEQIAKDIMPGENAGFHNQALMEFGALQCVPKSPDCNHCILMETCYAVQNNLVKILPVKMKRTKQRERFFYYYFIDDGENVYFEKRMDNDIWKNLYQFPLFETTEALTESDIFKNIKVGFLKECNFNIKKISGVKKHILSHQIIFARLIYVELGGNKCIKGKFIEVNKKDISKFAIPRLIEEFINDLNL